MQKSEIERQNFILINEAIQKAFPNKEWQLVDKLSNGLSSSIIYKVEIDNEKFVIKLDDPSHPHNNLIREYDAMQKSSDRLIAPKLFYADAEKGVVIIKYIDSPVLPLNEITDTKNIDRLAKLVRTVHQGPAFKIDLTIFKKVDAVYQIIPMAAKKSQIVTQAFAVKNHLEMLLDKEEDIVPAHGDINIYNILCDKDQLLLIDWNTAAQQNRYFDLATCFTYFYFFNEEASAKFVESYFGTKPSELETSKYILMKTFVSIYYGFMFLYQSSLSNQKPMEENEINSLPTYPEFVQKIIAGEEALDKPISQQKFAFVFFNNALKRSKEMEFIESTQRLNTK